MTTDIPANLPLDKFRSILLQKLDDALGHSWLVCGDNRKIIEGLRTYVPTMSEVELKKFQDSIPQS